MEENSYTIAKLTIREAVDILSNNPVAYPDPDAQGIWDQAMYMAINALKEKETADDAD